jgi:3-oxoacyl-ACP reductase-like protein
MSDTTQTEGLTLNQPSQQPVDRKRRHQFAVMVTGFCLWSSVIVTSIAGLGVLGSAPTLIDLYISGALSLATATTLAYITGSVIDYNGGIRNMISRGNKT